MDNKEKLKEAYRIFADAVLYSDTALLHYVDLISDVFDSTTEISCYFSSMEKYNVSITDSFFLISRINWAISELPYDDAELINQIYGLNGFDPTPLDQISKNIRLPYNVILKLRNSALRHLASPSKIIKAIIPFIREENAKRIDNNQFIIISDLSLEQFFNNSPLPGGINVKCYHALKRKGIKTVQNLLDFPEEELYKIRNLGPKSVEFILQKKKELTTM